jgi:hypothetical protein
MDDALTLRAIEQARAELARAVEAWRPPPDALEAVEAADAARILADECLAHLDAGRWDEALASAERAVELDEAWGDGESWREFSLRVEEAAETGRGAEP